MMAAHESTEPESILRRERVGGDPTDLGAREWKSTMKRVQLRMKQDRVTVSAGSLAYHWFLALFPAIIAGLGVLTLVSVGSGTLHHLTHDISRALPSGTAAVFNGAVRAATKKSSGSVVTVVIGVVVALWSASSGMAVLQQVLDVAYEVDKDQSFLKRRLRAIPLMGLVAVLGGCGGALIVFGQPIGAGLKGISPVGGTAFTVGWTVVRWVLALVLLSLLFSAVYYLAPNRKGPRWQWVSAGGLLATAIFLVVSLAFSFYVSSFGSYSKTYGSFAGVAILIFWFWLIGLAVLVGGELNAEVERSAASQSADGAAPVTIKRPTTSSSLAG